MPSETVEEISLANYLLERLAQLGAKSVFGVPGDFQLGLCDLVEDHPALEWIGNANELNAAYAADGYVRASTTAKVAPLVTTFGVGELSAVNGLAGAYAERLPIVHIVGVPSTSAQDNKYVLHHTLGDRTFDKFETMSRQVTVATLALGDIVIHEAPREIDRVLTLCVREARPVYIALRSDIVNNKVPRYLLDIPLRLSPAANHPDVEAHVLESIVRRITTAKDPIVIFDVGTMRWNAVEEAREFVEQSGLPVFGTPMGKTAIDEHHPQYGGMYIGELSDDAIKQRVHQTDCMVTIGHIAGDFNTGSFSYRTPQSVRIDLHQDRIDIAWAQFPEVGMKALLPKITAAVKDDYARRIEYTRKTITNPVNVLPTPEEEGDIIKGNPSIISHAWFWPRVTESFRAKDLVLAESGCSSFAILRPTMPSGVRLITQILWGSIGWSVGATLGVSLAARENNLGRTHLFVGDGSLQLAVQEIGTMIRHGLTPIIYVISNKGYTVEREIRGRHRHYNDIPTWNHSLLLQALSAPPDSAYNSADEPKEVFAGYKPEPVPSKTAYHAVRTKQDLEELLSSADFQTNDRIRLVEVFMKRDDVPLSLKRQAEAVKKTNNLANEAAGSNSITVDAAPALVAKAVAEATMAESVRRPSDVNGQAAVKKAKVAV